MKVLQTIKHLMQGVFIQSLRVANYADTRLTLGSASGGGTFNDESNYNQWNCWN